jgi:hypothetical protein
VLKKEFTYSDIDGNPITKTWYFNLSTAELAKMHLTSDGDLVSMLQGVIESKDGKKIIETFEDIIRRSVGTRGADGKSFVKSSAIAEEFMGSDAYSDFFVELITNATAAAEFINGIMPADLVEKAKQIQDQRVLIDNGIPPEVVDPTRQPMTVDNFSMDELLEMSREDLDRLNAGKMYDKPGAKTRLEDFDRQELLDMSDEKFHRIVGKDQKKWSKDVLVIAMMRRARK